MNSATGNSLTAKLAMALTLVATLMTGCSTTPVTDAQATEPESTAFTGNAVDDAAVADVDASSVTYRLSAGDELEVFVWKEEDLSREVTIAPDGSLSYPLAGDIKAAGLTVTELKGVLTDRIREYIPKALVTVSLVKVTGYRVYILGEVNKPGEYTPGNYVTVAQALTLAEGLTEFANGGAIRVMRQHEGDERVMTFNYGRFRKGRDLHKNIRLESGDVVTVP